MVSEGAQGSCEAVCKNYRRRGARGSPGLVAGVRLCSGGAKAIAGSLGVFLSGFVGGNGREGEVVL